MKKILFLSALASAMFAGCAKEEISESPVKYELYREAVCVNADIDQTKASFDNSLEFYWEAGDKLAVIKATDGSEKCSLTKETADESFKGEVAYTQPEEKAYFHFAYPGDNISFTNNAGQISTTVTIPTSQDGKWTPVLYGQAESTTISALTENPQLSNLSAAFGIIVKDLDGKTPKNIKRIDISANNPVFGVFSIENGVLSATEDSLKEAYIEFNEPTAKVEGHEIRFTIAPAEETEFTIKATDENGKTVTVKVSKTIAANHRGGVNIYWNELQDLEPAVSTWLDDSSPVNEGNTIHVDLSSLNPILSAYGDSISDYGIIIDGTVTKSAKASPSSSSKSIKTDNGLNITVGEIESGEHTVSIYYIYRNKTYKSTPKTVKVLSIPTVDIYTSHTNKDGYVLRDKINVYINCDDYTKSQISATQLFGNNSEIEGLTKVTPGQYSCYVTPGQYSCYVMISFKDENVVELYKDTPKTVKVLSIQTVDIYTSYTNKDGYVSKRNDIDGREIKVDINCDDYTMSQISATQLFGIGSEIKALAKVTPGKYNCYVTPGQYSCYVKISFKDENVVELYKDTPKTIYVTGIPYNKDKAVYKSGMNNGEWIQKAGGKYEIDSSNGYLRIGSNGKVTMTVHIPTDIKAKISYRIDEYLSSRLNYCKTKFIVCGNTILNTNDGGTATTKKLESEVEGTLKKDNNTIEVSQNNGDTPTWGSAHPQLYYVSIQYAN